MSDSTDKRTRQFGQIMKLLYETDRLTPLETALIAVLDSCDIRWNTCRSIVRAMEGDRPVPIGVISERSGSPSGTIISAVTKLKAGGLKICGNARDGFWIDFRKAMAGRSGPAESTVGRDLR